MSIFKAIFRHFVFQENKNILNNNHIYFENDNTNIAEAGGFRIQDRLYEDPLNDEEPEIIKGKGKPKGSLSRKRKLAFQNGSHHYLFLIEIVQDNQLNKISQLDSTSINDLNIHARSQVVLEDEKEFVAKMSTIRCLIIVRFSTFLRKYYAR